MENADRAVNKLVERERYKQLINLVLNMTGKVIRNMDRVSSQSDAQTDSDKNPIKSRDKWVIQAIHRPYYYYY